MPPPFRGWAVALVPTPQRRGAQLQAHPIHRRTHVVRKSALYLHPKHIVGCSPVGSRSSPLLFCVCMESSSMQTPTTLYPKGTTVAVWLCVMVIVSHRRTPQLREGSAGPSAKGWITIRGGGCPTKATVCLRSFRRPMRSFCWGQADWPRMCEMEHSRTPDFSIFGRIWGGNARIRKRKSGRVQKRLQMRRPPFGEGIFGGKTARDF